MRRKWPTRSEPADLPVRSAGARRRRLAERNPDRRVFLRRYRSGVTSASDAAHRDVDVRQRLRRDWPWILAFAGVVNAAFIIVTAGFGWDAHAYWLAARGPLYTGAPNAPDAYLYSPAFAQLISPVARLPWPVFAALFSLVSAVLLAWMLQPLGLRLGVALWLAATPELASGNIFIWLGALTVVGLRHPGAWVGAALTKVTPCLGPLWFAVRGEWRRLGISLGTIALVAGTSYLVDPAAWQAWFAFLGSHLASVGGPVGSIFVPGPAVHLPIAVVLVVWGARTNRVWTLPVAMVLATPVFGIAAVTMCAAIPRLGANAGDHSVRRRTR